MKYLQAITWMGLAVLFLGGNACDFTRIPALTLPVATFSVDKTTCEAPCTITITNTSSNALSYHWDFGNGQSAEVQNPDKIIYTVPGAYSIQLIALGEEGTRDTMVISVNITSEPVSADFSYTSDPNDFIPTTISFTNKSSSNAVEYLWNFGDPASSNNNTSALKNPSHLFSTPGTYIVSLTATTARKTVAIKKDTLTLKYRTFAVQLGSGSAISVLTTLDGGYLVTTDRSWIKTDIDGKKQWEYTPSSEDFTDPKAVQATNGDFYLAHEYKNASSFKKIRIVKLNSIGNYLKEQTLNSGEKSNDAFGDILINKDNQLILYGVFTTISSNPAKIEAKLFRLDLNLISNPTALTTVPDIISVSNVDLFQASDGNYLGIHYIAGSTQKHYLFALATNASSYKWQEVFSDASVLTDVTQVSSGNLIVIGTKTSGKAFISSHFLGNGDPTNAREFSYTSSSFNGISTTTDGQLITCGKGDLFLTKINTTSLQEIWHKPSSKFSNATANGLANTKDGGYIVAGSILVGPNNHVYLVKTDPNGDL